MKKKVSKNIFNTVLNKTYLKNTNKMRKSMSWIITLKKLINWLFLQNNEI